MARRLRVPISGLSSGDLTLSDEATHYLVRVHRASSGDPFVAFDPELGLEGDAELVSTGERRAICRVGALRSSAARGELNVTLLQGFGKADRIDQVVRDATALGATRVIVVETERSVVKLSAAPEPRIENRRNRWRKIAAEAARQSERSSVPDILGPTSFLVALAEQAELHEVRWCCDPSANESLSGALAQWRPEKSTLVLIGPEGGLSDNERLQATRAGLVAVRLGPTILRTETAATVVLGALWMHGAAR